MTNGMQIRFDGDSPLESTAWKVITATATGITPTGDVTGTVLYSGHTDQTDNFMILPVSVPATGDQRLAFDTLYNIEHTWDFGFTQVTTDTIGATGFKSLALSGTITAIDPQAEPIIQANVPGFSGVSGSQDAPSWVHVEYDLADYAGQDILLAFRYSTDGASAGTIGGPPAPGWYVDNLKVGDTALFTDEAAVPANAKSIAQARNQRARFMLNLVTFADTNGPAIGNVYAVPLNDDADGTFSMDTLLKDPGFDEAGERIVAIISYVPAPRDPDIIASGPVTTGSYSLTGLPPSLYTSRARLLGTASNTSILSPRVYPGDTFTVTVTVDNLGRNEDLKTTGPVDAYVAVPLPENTTFDPQSLQASLSASNITYTTSLQNVDNGLPATPGVYWHGPVTRTADLSFRLRAAAPLAIGTVITPTAHIANGPFSSNPSQRFTDLFRPVSVVSPFALSSATATPTARVGDTAIFTYTLINADDQTRDMTFRFQIPDGTSLERVNVNLRDPRSQTSAGETFELGLSVPSFARTGLTTVVAVELKLEPGFHGDTLNPMAELLQPGSTISFLATPLELAVPGGATTIEWNRVYIPVISNEAGNAS
jgi:hypothetical protein